MAKAQPERLLEALNEQAGFYFEGARLIDSGRTRFQDYEVWDTVQLGKLFRLDGCFMTSEGDEFFYHENLVHPAAIAHPSPSNALIIGGGDGGSAEELFKHPSIQRIVLVELDGQVIKLAQTHFQSVNKGALDDPRLDLHIADGLDYVRNTAVAASERFDLILLDLTDPVGPAAELYTEKFLHDCRALLTPEGLITLHIGAPFFHPQRVSTLVGTLRRVLTHVTPYFVYIPLYGALWGMATASDRSDISALSTKEVEDRIATRSLGPLQHYNGDVHVAQQALPNYLRALLKI